MFIGTDNLNTSSVFTLAVCLLKCLSFSDDDHAKIGDEYQSCFSEYVLSGCSNLCNHAQVVGIVTDSLEIDRLIIFFQYLR